jgi:hypothetical protein
MFTTRQNYPLFLGEYIASAPCSEIVVTSPVGCTYNGSVRRLRIQALVKMGLDDDKIFLAINDDFVSVNYWNSFRNADNWLSDTSGTLEYGFSGEIYWDTLLTGETIRRWQSIWKKTYSNLDENPFGINRKLLDQDIIKKVSIYTTTPNNIWEGSYIRILGEKA